MAALSLAGIIEDVLEKEKGYVNDPDDPGGETNWGISKRAYPHLDIKNLTKDQARNIYMADYIRAPGFDQLPPSQLRAQAIDYGVNSGVGTATKDLQRVLGVTPDGDVGPKTLAAARDADLRAANNQLVDRRIRFLGHQVGRNPRKARFIIGWLDRALSFLIP